jgi:probable rRNA maturation factor
LFSPLDPEVFLSEDGRVEVVFDLDELSESKISLVLKAAVAALDAQHWEGPRMLTVMITGDEEIRDLNYIFKDEDEVTDVLSFQEWSGVPGIRTDNEEWPDFPEIGDSDFVNTERLGDIVISLPQIERQAAGNGKSTERELAMITIHGVFHLLGYDHAEPEEEKIMFGKTEVVLAGIFGD